MLKFNWKKPDPQRFSKIKRVFLVIQSRYDDTEEYVSLKDIENDTGLHGTELRYILSVLVDTRFIARNPIFFFQDYLYKPLKHTL